jgi:prepilin-type processing-associated H-X9-DG protein
MDWALNGNGTAPPNQPNQVTKLSQITTKPTPSAKIVFVDENEDSIDNGGFGIHYLPATTWFNVPASRHGKTCTFSFIDGHSEIWKWRGTVVLTYATAETVTPTLPEDVADLRRVQNATFYP